jgi:large subunit ribosomal protein LP0
MCLRWYEVNVLFVLLQNDVHILKEGDKVGASDATLLNMLNISPFSYGLLVQMVYDSGTIFEPAILDIDRKSVV